MIDFDILMNYISLLSKEYQTVLKQNINKTVWEFIEENNGLFADYNFQGNLDFRLYPVLPIFRMTLKQFILLACCYNIRFISAQDREDRCCLTKSDGNKQHSRMSLQLILKSYKDMKENRKYVDSFDEQFVFQPPTPELEKILKNIIDTDNIAKLCQKEIIDQFDSFDWKQIAINQYNRRIQVIIYDLLLLVTYKQLVDKKEIVPAVFDMNFDLYNQFRNTTISDAIQQLYHSCDIVMLQETHLENYNVYPSDTKAIEANKPKTASVIHTHSRYRMRQVDYMYNSKNHDIVVAVIEIGPYKILSFSIHTPTTGVDTANIINDCFGYFQTTDCTHIIIGMDCNTRSTETKKTMIEAVLKNGGQLSHFPGTNLDTVLAEMVEKEKTGVTTMGIRTFGLQSQFLRAGEDSFGLIDEIITGQKDDFPVFKVLETFDAKNDILTTTNPSDHCRRQVTFQIGKIIVKVASWNVAGPNANMVEYYK